MNSDQLLHALNALNYPLIEGKTLGDLDLVKSANVINNKAHIVLSTSNDDAYAQLEKTILDQLSATFDGINISKLAKQTESINYGSAASPNNRAPYAKNVIAVTSGKGGVGKSTVAVNLAIALAQEGKKVGILDADVYGPNVPRLTATDLERMQWSDDDKIIPSENYGLKIMSVGLTTPRSDTPLVWRSSVAVSALIQFLEDVDWGELDFLVIDMPPGTGDIQLTMAEELPITAGVLITTPQHVSMDDVSRAIMMYKDIGVPIGGVIENMSYFIAPDTKQRYDIFGKGGGKRVADRYNIPFLGEIPLDMEIREGSDQGEPAVVMGSDEQKEYYKNIARNLMQSIAFS
jgi:ATP-binding protein involved in chromosome partitioning